MAHDPHQPLVLRVRVYNMVRTLGKSNIADWDGKQPVQAAKHLVRISARSSRLAPWAPRRHATGALGRVELAPFKAMQAG